jgi:serine/threonine-protein kinase
MDRDNDVTSSMGGPYAPAPEGAWIDDDGTLESRYVEQGALGRGGMGEVRACEDRRVGREVAMKISKTPGLNARFLQEARVQARLEHPSIVPVYDVGLDRDGAPYFTMKRVRGQTLKKILRGLRDGDPDTVANYSRRRLLTAFASVCLAVHYAHTKDVLHRDLKPTNIMLDEFGALYVLDWGLARGESLDDSTPDSIRDEVRAIEGTPRYMAPEQLVAARSMRAPTSTRSARSCSRSCASSRSARRRSAPPGRAAPRCARRSATSLRSSTRSARARPPTRRRTAIRARARSTTRWTATSRAIAISSGGGASPRPTPRRRAASRPRPSAATTRPHARGRCAR